MAATSIRSPEPAVVITPPPPSATLTQPSPTRLITTAALMGLTIAQLVRWDAAWRERREAAPAST